MRIKKPSPPNGILDMYVIKFNNQSTNFTPELCIMWKDYYCLNITEGIKANNNYTFEVILNMYFPIKSVQSEFDNCSFFVDLRKKYKCWRRRRAYNECDQ